MKLLARLVAVLGAVAVAWVLFGEGPRRVVLVYDLPPVGEATWLDVEILRGGETVRRTELRLEPPRGEPAQLRHEVRLPAGVYDVAWHLRGPGRGPSGSTSIEVREDGTIVLSLGR